MVVDDGVVVVVFGEFDGVYVFGEGVDLVYFD